MLKRSHRANFTGGGAAVKAFSERNFWVYNCWRAYKHRENRNNCCNDFTCSYW